MSWAHIQSTTGSATLTTQATLTTSAFGSSVTPGHLLVVGITNDTGTLTVTDSASNSYTKIASNSSSGITSDIWYAVANGSSGSGLTVVVTANTGSPLLSCTVDEYSFTAGTISIGTTLATQPNTATAPQSLGNLTITQTGLVVSNVFTNDGGNAATQPTWASPMTARNAANQTANARGC